MRESSLKKRRHKGSAFRRFQRRLAKARILFWLALPMLGACQPTIKGAGPAIMPPFLSDNSLIMADGAELALRTWLPEGEPRFVVLALHGMNDYSNAFDDAGRQLAEKGIAVFAYDQRGFGRSPNIGFWPGLETLAADARTASSLISSRYPKAPFFLMGESMGGAVAIIAMTSAEPPAVSGVILSAPAVWDRSSMSLFQRASLWIAVHAAPGLTLSGGNLDIMPSDNFEMLRALSKDPLVIKGSRVDAIKGVCDLMDEAQKAAPRLTGPVLVLYGENDEIIPVEPTYKMAHSLTDGKRLALYPDGWHMLMRDLEAKIVLADIVAWIEDQAAPLPSGADLDALEILKSRAAKD